MSGRRPCVKHKITRAALSQVEPSVLRGEQVPTWAPAGRLLGLWRTLPWLQLWQQSDVADAGAAGEESPLSQKADDTRASTRAHAGAPAQDTEANALDAECLWVGVKLAPIHRVSRGLCTLDCEALWSISPSPCLLV